MTEGRGQKHKRPRHRRKTKTDILVALQQMNENLTKQINEQSKRMEESNKQINKNITKQIGKIKRKNKELMNK